MDITVENAPFYTTDYVLPGHQAHVSVDILLIICYYTDSVEYMADHTTYSKDPVESLTNAAPPTYSQVVWNAPSPYQPTNIAEVQNTPNMVPRYTSAPVVTVSRTPLANELSLSEQVHNRIQIVKILVIVSAVIFSFLGTPLMLLVFLPSIYFISKVRMLLYKLWYAVEHLYSGHP